MVAGVGVPQLTAIMDVAPVARRAGVPMISDGGIKYSGDLAKAMAAGADCAMLGSMFAGTDEAPGEVVAVPGPVLQGLPRMGSPRRHGARVGRPLFPSGGDGAAEAGCRRGSRAGCPTRGRSRTVIHQLVGGLRAAMGYTGSHTIATCRPMRRSSGSLAPACGRAMSTTWRITHEPPNYRRDL